MTRPFGASESGSRAVLPRGARIRASDRCRDRSRTPRRGATLVEAAIVLSLLLSLVMGAVELALVVSRYNIISEAACQGAREAIVRGELAPPRRSAWGPQTQTGTAGDGTEIAEAIRPALVGIDPDAVSISMVWPDASNSVQRRVRCTVSTSYRPVLTSLFTSRELALSATSTMIIAH